MSDFAPKDVSTLIRYAKEFHFADDLFRDLCVRHTDEEGTGGFPIADWQRVLYILTANEPPVVNTFMFGQGGYFMGAHVEISRQTYRHGHFEYRYGFDGKRQLAFILNLRTRMRRYIYDPKDLSRELSLDEQVPASRVLTHAEIAAFKYDH